MIDFIRLRKELQDGEILCLDNLIDIEKYDARGKHYYIKNVFNHILLIHNANNGVIEISGSLLYYIQGHNFTFSMDKFIEAVNGIGEKLHLNIWNSTVERLEFGVIMEIDEEPSCYILRHHDKEGENLKEDGKLCDLKSFKWWCDSNVSIKMYDARKNAMNKVSSFIRNEIKEFNSKSQYLKFEVHYKKPYIVLNHGKDIKLSSIIMPEWIDRLKEDLLLQYGRLKYITGLKPPKCKKELSTADWFLRSTIMYGLDKGYKVEDIKKDMYGYLKSCDVINEDDRKARQQQFLNRIKLIEYNTESLTDKIINALILNEQCYIINRSNS